MASKNEKHWTKTRTLMWIVLAIWAFFSFGIHAFVEQLNTISFLGFPLGFYMASQGALIAFVVLIFWYVRRQQKIDEEFDFHESQEKNS